MPQSPPALVTFWNSSIGKKIVVALTGLVLVFFLIAHLSGNLLIFVGQKAFNDYAYFLHHLLHGAGVWIARVVLLTSLVLHVVATVQLTIKNRASRTAYQKEATQRASKSSRIMIWSGFTVLAFIIYHLLHFTARLGPYSSFNDLTVTRPDGSTSLDAYQMVINGFSSLPAVIFYVIAISLLCSHLSHGVASIFQTLGLSTSKTRPLYKKLALIYSAVIWVGFLSIPIAIYFFRLGQA